MRPVVPLVAVTLLMVRVCLAQQAPATEPARTAPAQAAAAPPGPVLRVNSQLVVLDVVVEDKSGHPVHGLKAQDFHVTEDKAPQTVRHFEEHTSASAVAQGPALPKFPPGVYTDYTPVAPDGTLNLLLLDALNTPMKDQSYVRDQLRAYVKHADPAARIAIFGLANNLILLQGFTSDPATLRDVVAHKLIPRSSSLLDNPVSGGDSNTPQMSDLVDPSSGPGMAELAANLQQFEAEESSMQTQMRVQYTLDALNTLAHYLSAFPGRKNLIWFSGSFPLNILPDPTLTNPFGVQQVNEEEYRETATLLTKAQVSVYPIDARGLMTNPAFSASNAGSHNARTPQAFSAAVQKFNTSQTSEHATMEQLAEDTGGHAFYNTNGLADAVAKAISEGSNYYTLSYSPTDQRHNGSYRTIHVSLSTTDAADLQLAYRHGYFDDDASEQRVETASAATSADTTSVDATRTAYARAAMSRGAPMPEDVLFKVRVLPASKVSETTLAPGNSLDPIAPAKGPFRRYDVDFAALPSAVTMTPGAGGVRTGEIAFLVYVFDRNGRLLDSASRGYKLRLGTESYKQFLSGAIQCHMEVSVPERMETYIRMGVEDVMANRFGVVEIPTAQVSHLPPAVYAAQPGGVMPGSTTAPSKSTPSTPSTPAATPPGAASPSGTPPR
jgi:VWFA-related protein